MRALCLMYHDVVEPGREEESGFPGGPARIYKLPRPLFAAHLDAIGSTGAPVCNDVGSLSSGTTMPVLFTFDDGGVSFLDPIAGMLEAHGWRGHFFITTGRIGTAGFLSAPQLRELAARGHVVGSHSVHHPVRMAELPAAQIAAEWSESKKALEDILGAAADTASVPGGYSSPVVAQAAAEAGYRVLFHSEPVTRQSTAGALRLLGRFALMESSPASLAAGLARGDKSPRAKLWAIRTAKKLAKAAGGDWLIRQHARRLDR